MAAAGTVIIDIVANFVDNTRRSLSDLDRVRNKFLDIERNVSKIGTTAASIAKKTITIPIKILDYATSPLRKLFNFATSLKGLLTGIVVGKLGSLAISRPLSLADQYSSAFTGFESLFKSTEKAQKMMNDLDEFARTTPYKTANVIEQTQKMLAMGWDAQRLIPDMETIGNAAAATGRGDEGLSRIVLALAQIKSKGKLSTEELNQLAEAGVNAKQYIAQGLGYGTGDAAQQQLAAQLQKGAIGGNAAVEMILAGMERDYGGMMQGLARNTVSGIKSNIEDTFEINIFRKWGQGLQDGAKRGLGAFADMLDANQERLSEVGDKLQQVASYLSNKFASAAEFATGKLLDIFDSPEFNEASLIGKFKMVWNGIIGDPFREWWSNTGQESLANLAEDIGSALGKVYKGGILTLLGIQVDGAIDDGMSIGKRFAQGFLDGFDAKTVGQAILTALKDAFKSAGKILPGGEQADTSSYVSAALLGYGAYKIGMPLLKAGVGIAGVSNSIAGAFRATDGGMMNGAGAGWLPRILGSTGNTMARGSGMLGSFATTGYALTGGAATSALSGSAAAAIGAGSLAGGVLGGLGLLGAFNDFRKAAKTANKKEQNTSLWSGAVRTSMVGGGAAAGAALGSAFFGIGAIPGALIGAGIGGLGALFGGGKLGKTISDYLDGTDKIQAARDKITELNDSIDQTGIKTKTVDGLIDRYKQLQDKLDDPKLTEQEAVTAQSEQKSIVEQLAQIYPSLITQYELENGELREKLGLLRDINDADKKRTKIEAEQAAREGNKALPALNEKIAQSEENIKEYTGEKDKYKKMMEEAETIEKDWNAAQQIYDPKSAEYTKAYREFADKVSAFNMQYDTDYSVNAFASDSVSKKIGKKYDANLEASVEEQQSLDSSMATLSDTFTANKQNFQFENEFEFGDSLKEKVDTLKDIQGRIKAINEELSKDAYKTEEGRQSDTYKGLSDELEAKKAQAQEIGASLEENKTKTAEFLAMLDELSPHFAKLPEYQAMAQDAYHAELQQIKDSAGIPDITAVQNQITELEKAKDRIAQIKQVLSEDSYQTEQGKQSDTYTRLTAEMQAKEQEAKALADGLEGSKAKIAEVAQKVDELNTKFGNLTDDKKINVDIALGFAGNAKEKEVQPTAFYSSQWGSNLLSASTGAATMFDPMVKGAEGVSAAVDKIPSSLEKVGGQVDAINGKLDTMTNPKTIPVRVQFSYTNTTPTISPVMIDNTGRKTNTPAVQLAAQSITGFAGFATGTDSAPPGMAWVGENGKELVQFDGGERVYTADQSRRIAAADKIIHSKYKTIGAQISTLSAQSDTGRVYSSAQSVRIAEQVDAARSSSTRTTANAQDVSIALGGIHIQVDGGNAQSGVVEQIRRQMPEVANELCRNIAVQMSKIYANMGLAVEGV